MEWKLDEAASEALPLNVDRMWLDEADWRYRQLKDGNATSIAGDGRLARLEARSRR